MRWWAGEEERIRLETMAASIPDSAGEGNKKSGKKTRQKPPFKGNQKSGNSQTAKKKNTIPGDRNNSGRAGGHVGDSGNRQS